ncbi:hypothetical protein HanPI659440_Chr16g0652431 [Helianthus annuus]|nr:hypothetical protein HanPI659440_Chr16g0652431 [Helianthus annuus]
MFEIRSENNPNPFTLIQTSFRLNLNPFHPAEEQTVVYEGRKKLPALGLLHGSLNSKSRSTVRCIKPKRTLKLLQ